MSREDLQSILSKHVSYLASDALDGREVGSMGINEAENYIAETFESFGLTPLPGREDYFLEFLLYRGGFDPEATTLAIRIGGTTIEGLPGVDFRPFDFSATGSYQGELVFAGYGITAPEYGYDDYAGLETEGKIVLLLRHEPQSPVGSDYFQGADLTRHSLLLNKAKNAQVHGALGMLLITDPKSSTAAEDFRLEGPMALQRDVVSRNRADQQPLPAIHIAQSFAEKMLEGSDLDLQELQERLDRVNGTSELHHRKFGEMNVHLEVAMEQSAEEVQARNVAAFLPGSDPILKDQWILIGAHHDHLGSFSGEGDTVFNGADDNASGTAGVLALAWMLSKLDPPPARSVVFTTFSAEERGLLGSREMVSTQVQTDNIVLMINLDMIGRNPDQPLRVMGSGSSPEVRRLTEAANRELQLSLSFSDIPGAAVSDHDPFHRQGIPFLFFFTGMHDDYHGTDDESERISYSRLAEVVELTAETVILAAEMESEPGSTIYVDWLGMSVEMPGEPGLNQEEARPRVIAVEAGEVADQRGLREGDNLLEVAGRAPNTARELRQTFEAVNPGGSLSLTIQRGQEQLELQVRRRYAGYLGVMIGDVDEQWHLSNNLEAKSGVLIHRVLEDGPAKQAGLKPGDVLLAIDGIPVGPMNLRTVLTKIGADVDVELSVIREGKPFTMPLSLGRRP
jgi:hypothetical protein